MPLVLQIAVLAIPMLIGRKLILKGGFGQGNERLSAGLTVWRITTIFCCPWLINSTIRTEYRRKGLFDRECHFLYAK